MFSRDALASDARPRGEPKAGSRRIARRSRPLSLAQEVFFLGVTFTVGLLLELAAVLRLSGVID